MEVAFERPGAVDGVVPLAGDVFAGGIGEVEGDAALGETAAQLSEEQVHDLLDLVQRERLEENDLVDPVEEFGPEMAAEFGHHRFAGLLRDLPLGIEPLHEERGADIGGHDDQGVLEVDRAALAVGESPIVEDLEEGVEDVGVGLLDFVEQNHAVGAAADGFGQLAAFLVANVAGRGPDQAGYGVFLHVFGHVDPHHGVLAVEERGGESPGQLRLAHAGGAEEEEGADRALWILQAGAGTDDGIGDGLDGLVLADDPFVENLVEAEELFLFALQKAGDGDAGPAGDNLADFLGGDFLADELGFAGFALVLFFTRRFGRLELLFELRKLAVLEFGHLVEVVGALGGFDLLADLVDLLADLAGGFHAAPFRLPLGLQGVPLGLQIGQFFLQCLEALLGGGVFLFFEGFALNFQLQDAALEVFQLFGHGFDFRAELGGGLVDEVDGLVGKKTIGDVAVGEDGGGNEGGVLDADPVMDFVPLPQAAKDGNGVFHRGFLDENGLEAAFEGGVLLDVLAVLVEGGGADAVELAAGEHGLEHVAGVHRALGLAGADDGVDLVDKEDDAALGLGDLGEDGLEALLEFAAELGSGDEGAEVERDDALLLEAVGHVPGDNPAGKALDDGGFADTGFADEDRVILGAAGEDLDGAADLLVAADDGVELALAGEAGEVSPVLFEGFVGGFRIGGGDALAATDGLKGGEELVLGNPELLEDLGGAGVGLLVESGKEKVLHTKILVLELFRGLGGAAEKGLEARGDVDTAARRAGTGDLGETGDFRFNAVGKFGGLGTEFFQQAGDEAVLLGSEGVEEVFDLDGLVALLGGLGLGRGNRLLGVFGELVQVHEE